MAENLAPDPIEELRGEVRDLTLAVKIFMGALLFVICALSARAAASVMYIRSIFNDILGGKPLPALTEIVLRSDRLLLTVSVLLLVVGLASLMLRVRLAVMIVAGLIVVALSLLCAICFALLLPFLTIITSMQAG